jgi:GNAT superfamily N-acetyltransferase
VIRDATSADLAAVLGLYRQMHPNDPELDGATIESVFGQIEASPQLRLLVLELDGAVVATTYLNLIPNLTRAAAPYAVVENVVVDESRRRTGLGKQLMAGTLAIAWDAGCYKVMLMTGSTRPATHAFYRACGFDGDAKHAYLARPI